MTTTSQAAQIGGGVWNIDPNHSLIEFSARHFDIAYVKGRFKSFSGKIDVDEQDLLNSRVELTIDTSSLDSQAVAGREDLIKGEEMLETSKFPTSTLTLNKSDFGVPFNREFEPGRAVVGEQIKIELQIEAAPAPPAS